MAVFLILCASARADSGAELATAKADFARLQLTVTSDVNRLDPELRGLIWARYYQAREQLQRMDVHQQMMVQHNQDRGEQFARAYTEFNRAVEELDVLLLQLDKPAPE